MLNVTNIPAPRVSIIDERTGLISREWYRFFLNLFTLVGQGNNQTSLDDLQVGPPTQAINIILDTNNDVAPSTAPVYINVSDYANLLPPAPSTNAASDYAGLLPPASASNITYDYANLLPAQIQQFIVDSLGTAPPVIPPSIATNGTVTSVDVSGGTTGMSFTGGPITTSGTITMSGTLGTANGGTGVTSTASNGQLLIGNGSGYSLSTLTAGTNIAITNSSGGITIAATGGTGTVTSVAASGGATGLTFSGSPITTSGTLTLGGTLGTANGGTGATSLTSAGIVTLTDSQVITGQKNFTNFSCTYAGTTYATTNAYFGESSSYAVIGGVNGVVLASGATYPGTGRYVADAVSFRPYATTTYSCGTSIQRWTAVYSQNLDLSGVVTAGTWNGSTIGISYGGTGSTTQSGARTSLGVPAAPTGSSAQLLANNGAGEFSNVSVGTGLSYSGGTLSATNTGTVTSVSGSGGSTGLTLTGGPITTSGTLTLGGTLATGSGGTGASSLTGAGIVTITDTQTISGVKTFSSTSNAFVGATYKTSNAYFYEDTSYAVLGGVNGVVISNGAYPGTQIFAGDSGTWRPTADNTRALGTSVHRYTTVYATTGTINTSDALQKQQVRELSDAEQRVAQRVKKLIRAFKWNDAVEQKGDDARIHFGVIAQDVQEAFAAEGLDASKYGLFCSDTWTNSDGSSQTRLGVRYSELLAFVIAAL